MPKGTFKREHIERKEKKKKLKKKKKKGKKDRKDNIHRTMLIGLHRNQIMNLIN